jgi:DNA-binding FadR family transcriptional regulator
MFEPIQKKSLTDAVFEQLRDRILAGEVEPGRDLPSERVLADMLKVSRPAVREALRRLEQARLVAIRQGEATRVRRFREEAGMDLLAELLVSPEGQIDTVVARSIMEMRSVLAPDIARLAAVRGAGIADRLERILEEMRAAAEDPAALQRLSLSFWDALVDGCGNVAYRFAFNALRETYGKIEHLLTTVMAVEWGDLASYEGIVAAVRNARPAAAERHARVLVGSGAAALAAVLEEIAPPEEVAR